jgi:phosphate transport system substrate-binding protein
MSRLITGKKGIGVVLTALGVLCALLGTIGSVGANPGTLKVEGSTTINPIAQASKVPFETLNPGITLAIDGTSGSGVGIKKLLCNQIEVGMASRETKPSDYDAAVALCGAGTAHHIEDADDAAFAQDGVCPIVKNSTNMGCVNNVTKAQLKQIYEDTGNTLKWNSISGSCPAQDIVPRARILDSGTRSSWIDILGISDSFEKTVISATGLDRLQGNPEMATAIGANDWQIGYVGLGFIDDPNLKVLTVDSVPCNPGTVAARTYPVSRSLHYYTLKPSVDPDYNPETQTYVNFMFTKQMQEITEQQGYVSIAPDWDVNVDHTGNIVDIVAIGLEWGASNPKGWIREDVNNDGNVNIVDIVAVGLDWGNSW